MWLPDAHLCYFILSAARLCVAVLLHGAATSSAISPQMHQQNPADAPPESRGTIRIRRTPTESCLHLQRVESEREQRKLWLYCYYRYKQFDKRYGFSISIGNTSRGRWWITRLAGISGLGPDSEPRGNNQSFRESWKLASALVCRWRRSGHVTRSSAWLIPHIFLK